MGPEESTEVKMLVDTGADMSTIPKTAVSKLEGALGRSIPYDIVLTEDFDGKKSMLKRYNFKVEVWNGGSKFEHTIGIIAVDDEEGVLGRDILNNYILTLNGPELRWSLEK
jgi:hypothetical protein